MNKLVVDIKTEKKILNGIQLLDETVMFSNHYEDSVVELYSKTNKFLAIAYLSSQNKGKGWVISRSKITLSKSYFVALFQQARENRLSYENDESTTAYRLFNQDGDHFGGLSIDRYNNYAVFSWYNSFVYDNRNLIIEAFQEVFPDIEGAYEKVRFQTSYLQTSAHLYGKELSDSFPIKENGVSYSVFLNDGLMTGIFLDQHEVRGLLSQGKVCGMTVLNLFSYTAAFSVAATMGGARETTSVDLAKRSRELSEAHFKLNGLDNSHKLVVMDVFDYLRFAKRKGLQFDTIIIDPPSFARNKKQTFSVAKDYHRLIEECLAILSPKGSIIASTNASNLSIEQFKKELDLGFGQVEHTYEALYQLPADFAVNPSDERSNYLKVFIVKVNK